MLPHTIDFETKKIEDRPVYPPVPVSLATLEPGKAPRYYAWGHPIENNCTKSDVKKVLKRLYSERPILCHRTQFDLEVAYEHFDMPLIPKYGIEDTLFLAFLNNPREKNLKLKYLADKYLSLPPVEQEQLRDWIIENYMIPRGIKDTKKTPWGAYISEAPGKLVGRYAKGDVIRTLGLFKFMHPQIVELGMTEAYEREKKLVPIIVDMERKGVLVNLRKLKKDTLIFEKERDALDKKIRRRLKIGRDININSGRQLAPVLEAAGKIDKWILTKKGNKSTSKDNLKKCCNDKGLIKVLERYMTINHTLNNFALPWIEKASANDGYINPSFNQTRNPDDKGTKTGRFSSSNPNFQNIPAVKELKDLPKHLLNMQVMRSYILPDVGGVFLNRDYSQQEFRILAHYEDGPLLRRYQDNPNLDMHEEARLMILELTRLKFLRKPVKNLGFGLIYGMGKDLLSEKTGLDLKTTLILKKAYLQAIPGIKTIQDEIRRMVRNNEPIVTWGGRLYGVEEPRIVDGSLKTYEYKLLNVLIQGSAADATKEAMIRVNEACDSRIVLQVHDELMNCAERSSAKIEMKRMKEAMESLEFDVKMLSDGEIIKGAWAKAA